MTDEKIIHILKEAPLPFQCRGHAEIAERARQYLIKAIIAELSGGQS